jgi:hypothetical protein
LRLRVLVILIWIALLLLLQEDAMPRKADSKSNRRWEKEQGSGVWWIRFRAEGKLKREKVGRKSERSLISAAEVRTPGRVKLPMNMRALREAHS